MSTFKTLSRVAAVTALVAATASSNAAMTGYTDAASFAAAITGAATDSFDDLELDLLASSADRTVGSYGYTASSPSGLFGAGSGVDHWLSNAESTEPLVLDAFTGSVAAIGGVFFGTDIDGLFSAGRTITVTATDSANDTLTAVLTNATVASFVGFVGNGTFITSLSFSPNEPIDSWAAVNDLVLAQAPAVPEPATYGMLLAGLAAVAFVRRRRT